MARDPARAAGGSTELAEVSALPLQLPLAGGLADLIGIRKVLLFVSLIVLRAGAMSVHHTREEIP